MGLAQVYSAAITGLDSHIVTIDVDVATRGLSAFQIVGLPDVSVNESRERVRTAIINTGFDFPARRIIVNLAPADLPKSGPIYDLPIALGILLASGQIQHCPANSLIVGELSLDGQLRSINGALPIALGAKKMNFDKIVLPISNQTEASFVEGIKVFGCQLFSDIIRLCTAEQTIEPHKPNPNYPPPEEVFPSDFADIRGQLIAKRALEIAAAGFHNVLLHGPPGSGKTLLAKALPSILPKMSKEEILEVSQIYSVSGLLSEKQPLIFSRPFRSPHHTSSATSIIGGGTHPKPGEITLAHRGVLFLDELPEFPRNVLEALRQPLEDRFVTVSRAAGSCQFPAHFILVAACNPCPCGNLYDPKLTCRCSPWEILRYQKKLSGPLLDRIDLHVEVPRVKTDELMQNSPRDKISASGSSAQIRQRVEKAREIQKRRFADSQIDFNSEMKLEQIEHFCQLDEECRKLISQAIERLNLSARAFHRVLKISRTIADLDNSENIKQQHLTEALQYRPKERR